MQVYVVEGVVDYEFSEVLSVESSAEDAEKFVADYRARVEKQDARLRKGVKLKSVSVTYDSYIIYSFTVGKPNTKKVIKR